MLSRALKLMGDSRTAKAVVTRTTLRAMSRRFVPGDSVDDLLGAVRQARGLRLATTTNYLGEAVEEETHARAAAATYVRVLDRLSAEGLEANVSIKLTQLGHDIGPAVLAASLAQVLERARDVGALVRFDMESSAHTTRTLETFTELSEAGWTNIGVVLQANLRRTADDVARMIRLGAPVRLCKDAYLEPAGVAFQDKAEVDRSFVTLARRLLSWGHRPALATHDERMIDAALEFVARESIPNDAFEFQMLHGVRRDLQRQLATDGWRVRVYVPFGEQWYPYLMRRLAERPANVLFLAGSLVRESPIGFLLPGRRRPRRAS
ncbi:MAG: proline dehydrogenase [Gemmatimonadetes bacterium]|nr:proline dehydrogenase [Gemmatimonadota bacterium]